MTENTAEDKENYYFFYLKLLYAVLTILLCDRYPFLVKLSQYVTPKEDKIQATWLVCLFAQMISIVERMKHSPFLQI